MLRKFLNRKRDLEREKEEKNDILLPVVIEEDIFSGRNLIVEKLLKVAIVILGILLFRQYMINQDLQNQIDFNRRINIAVEVKKEIIYYKQIFSFYELDEMNDEITYFEERINLSVNLESLLKTCSDYYDWKICSGLEATHFI